MFKENILIILFTALASTLLTSAAYYVGFDSFSLAENSKRSIFTIADSLGYPGIDTVVFQRGSKNVVLMSEDGATNIPSAAFFNQNEEKTMLEGRKIKDSLRIDRERVKSVARKTPQYSPPPKTSSIENNDQRILTEMRSFLFKPVLKEMSVFYPAETEIVKDTLTVFSDPSCPHCREFHFKYLPRLLKDGYNVQYILIARVTGINADKSYRYNRQIKKNLQWAMCLPNQKEEIDKLFKSKGRAQPKAPEKCDDTKWNVENNINLSFHFVNAAKGTPAIFSKSGYASNLILSDGVTRITPGIANFSEEAYQQFVSQLEVL